MLVLGFFLGALAAAAGAVWAWRGKRVDRKPVCARCRFDLTGVALVTCPECGAGLKRRRGVAHGRRRRRRVLCGVLAAASAMCLVGTLALLVDAGQRQALNGYKPEWMLAWEVSLREGTWESAALKELTSRAAKGSLDQSTLRRVAREGLRQQGLLRARIDAREKGLDHRSIDQEAGRWHVWIEAAIAAGALEADDLIRYVRQGVRPGAVHRSRCVAGTPLRYESYCTDSAGLISRRTAMRLRFRLLSVEIDGRHAGFEEQERWVPHRVGGTWNRGTVRADGPAGRYTLKMTWEVEVFGPQQDEPAGSFEHVQETMLELLASGPAVKILDDQESVVAFEKSLRVAQLVAEDDLRPRYVNCTIECLGPPAPLYARVELRGDGRVVDLGAVHWDRDSGELNTSAETLCVALPDDMDLDAAYDLVITAEPEEIEASTVHESVMVGKWVIAGQRLTRRSGMERGK